MGRPKLKDKPKKRERRLYKIGHLTTLLGVTPRTVRYYDQFGLLPHVKRSEGRVRLFDEEDVALIKKIRHMQRNEYLPLDVIRERLFGSKKKLNERRIAIVTDASANIPQETAKELGVSVVKISATNTVSESDLIKAYDSLAKGGIEEVFSIHPTKAFSKIAATAKLAANKVSDRVKVTVVDSTSIGGGTGLLVQTLAKAVDRGDSIEQVTRLLNKNLPLVHDLFYTNSLRPLVLEGKELPDVDATKKDLLEKLFQFKTILHLKKGQFEVVDCLNSQEKAIDLMMLLLEQEIEARGKYIDHITVSYSFLYSEALDIVNRLKQSHKTVQVTLEPANPILAHYLGTEVIGIAII